MLQPLLRQQVLGLLLLVASSFLCFFLLLPELVWADCYKDPQTSDILHIGSEWCP
jgi:hypothetical protein